MNFAAGISDRKRKNYYILGITLILTMAIGFIASTVQAQSTNRWSDPVNLSQSGSARDPVIVVDSDGIFHVLWNDEFAGLIYVTGDGIEWSAPAPIVLPSKDVMPFFIADTNGFVHAFWREIDERPFSEDKLFYSRGRASAFPSFSNWSSKAQIAESPLDFDVAIDGNGDLHLSFVKSLETEVSPAGVYYRRLRAGSSTWSTPELLYASPYFRSLELVDSNVDVSSSMIEDGARVFVAWDNRPRERVYLAASEDGGQTWSLPIEVDQPQVGLVGSGPSAILVDSIGEDVMLLWRKGSSDSFCNQYFQWSKDGGINWSLHQPVFGSIPFCFSEFQLMPDDQDRILMGKADQAYMIAWDGSRWSNPQIQEPLTSFVDSDTQNMVNIGCWQSSLVVSNSLYMVGCDEGIGSDIWLLKRQLIDVFDWFPKEDVWSPLEKVVSVEAKINSPTIATDGIGRVHLFWSQVDSVVSQKLGKSIFYTVRKDGQWSPSSEILASPYGKADQPEAASDSEGQLFVVWSGGDGGEIYFSRSDGIQPFLASSWSEPVSIPSPLLTGSSPDILIDSNDVIYVSYAIPLNEERGIYITSSDDLGQSWSQSVTVFDAQSAGWDMADDPLLAMTGNEHLHLIWTRYSLPSGEGPLELYYASSEDGGLTWTTPRLVVEAQIVWSQIAASGEETVHRVWQQENTSGSTLWHEQSVDDGVTWERVAPVSVFGETVGKPSLSLDKSGRLHLLLVVRSGVDSFILQNWVYDGQSWSAEPNMDLQFSPDTEINSIVSEFSQVGNLDVILLNNDITQDGNEYYQLFFTNQAIDLPEAAAAIVQITPTQETTLTTLPIIQATTPSPSPPVSTETPVLFPVEPENRGNLDLIAIGGPVVIGLIVILLIIIVVRWIRR